MRWFSLLLTKEVAVYSSAHNRKYYEENGYDFTNKRFLIVKVEDLHPDASQKVKVLCDYCLEEGIETICNKSWKDYNFQRKDVSIDSCTKCQAKKIKDVSQKKYGVNNPSQTPEVIEKIRSVFQTKYGVDNIMDLPETFEKILNTTEERYGYKYILGTEYGQLKFKATNLERYGSEQYINSESFKETSLERHGYVYAMQDPEKRPIMLEKIKQSLYKNGTAPCSVQQTIIHQIIGGELNYLVSRSFVDIAFLDEKIYVECDFSGHWMCIKLSNMTEKEFETKERKRWYALNNLGWKEIRIISRENKLPKKETILEMIRFAKEYINTGHSWIKFDIDNKTVKCSQFEIPYEYGRTRVIKTKHLLESPNY